MSKSLVTIVICVTLSLIGIIVIVGVMAYNAKKENDKKEADDMEKLKSLEKAALSYLNQRKKLANQSNGKTNSHNNNNLQNKSSELNLNKNEQAINTLSPQEALENEASDLNTLINSIYTPSQVKFTMSKYPLLRSLNISAKDILNNNFDLDSYIKSYSFPKTSKLFCPNFKDLSRQGAGSKENVFELIRGRWELIGYNILYFNERNSIALKGAHYFFYNNVETFQKIIKKASGRTSYETAVKGLHDTLSSPFFVLTNVDALIEYSYKRHVILSKMFEDNTKLLRDFLNATKETFETEPREWFKCIAEGYGMIGAFMNKVDKVVREHRKIRSKFQRVINTVTEYQNKLNNYQDFDKFVKEVIKNSQDRIFVELNDLINNSKAFMELMEQFDVEVEKANILFREYLHKLHLLFTE